MSSAPDPLVNAGIHCPACDYNLTGLTSGRCPECGVEVNLAELALRASDRVSPATPWDSPVGDATFTRFWKTLDLAAFFPKKLATEFPHRHDSAKARNYSVVCYALAFLLVCSGTAVESAIMPPRNPPGALVMVLLTALVAVIACWSCEILLAMLLAAVSPAIRPLNRYHFWRGLTHYTSGFTLVTASWGVMLFLVPCLDLHFYGYRRAYETLAVVAGILAPIVFGWWTLAWWGIIGVRIAEGPRRSAACLCVAVVGLGTIVAGIILANLLFAIVQDAYPSLR